MYCSEAFVHILATPKESYRPPNKTISEIKDEPSLLGTILAVVHAVDVCDLLALGDVPGGDEDGDVTGVDPADSECGKQTLLF